jgi:hypothetical protein
VIQNGVNPLPLQMPMRLQIQRRHQRQGRSGPTQEAIEKGAGKLAQYAFRDLSIQAAMANPWVPLMAA